MIKFIEIKYRAYELQVVNEALGLDLQNNGYYWFGAKKDFDCKRIHPNIIKVFMASKKAKNQATKKLFRAGKSITIKSLPMILYYEF